MYIGEALRLLKALQWVHELGPTDFELDYKKVVDSFVANRRYSKEFEAIINDYKILFVVNYMKTRVLSLYGDKQTGLPMN